MALIANIISISLRCHSTMLVMLKTVLVVMHMAHMRFTVMVDMFLFAIMIARAIMLMMLGLATLFVAGHGRAKIRAGSGRTAETGRLRKTVTHFDCHDISFRPV